MFEFTLEIQSSVKKSNHLDFFQRDNSLFIRFPIQNNLSLKSFMKQEKMNLWSNLKLLS